MTYETFCLLMAVFVAAIGIAVYRAATRRLSIEEITTIKIGLTAFATPLFLSVAIGSLPWQEIGSNDYERLAAIDPAGPAAAQARAAMADGVITNDEYTSMKLIPAADHTSIKEEAFHRIRSTDRP